MSDPTPRRKLAAILAADVAGFSRMMGESEDRTLRTLHACRAIIDESIATNHGRIFNTAGDSVVAEFASPVDAVVAAVEFQKILKDRNLSCKPEDQMQFRVGLNLGDVIVEGENLYGEGINIAARLESISAAGGICVAHNVFSEVRKKLDGIGFSHRGSQTLKNIDEPIDVYDIKPDQTPERDTGTPKSLKPPRQELALPDKPSIAVLAFQNLSGEAEQEYFADGMAEDIITGLARIKWLFVIARNSSFVYKGKAVDIKQVGRELGVRYVLEGSVRRAGSRLRITGQLIEAETGTHLWAERYDGAFEELFDLQDKITDSVIGILEPSILQAEIDRARRKHPENLDAYDLFLQAQPYFASITPEKADKAITLLAKSLELDPNFGPAHAFMAWAYEIKAMRGSRSPADVEAGLRHARAALIHGNDDATALSHAALVIALLGHDLSSAFGAITRALAINESSASALYWGALIYNLAGEFKVAEEHAKRALRLSPFDPVAYVAHLALGCVCMQTGDFAQAAACFAQALQANPRMSDIHAYYAASLALDGRLDLARESARKLLELEPGFRIGTSVFAGMAKFAGGAVVEPFVKGLRLSGLPD